MNLTIFLGVTFVATRTVLTYSMNYAGYKVVKVTPRTVGDLVILEKIATNPLVDPWSNGILNGSIWLQLNPRVIRKVEGLLTLSGISYTTIYDDLQRAIDKERLEIYSATRLSFVKDPKNFDFSRYHKLEGVHHYLQYISKTYRRLAKIINIGKSYESRNILGMHIHSQSGVKEKPAVVLEHGIHAREWISPATALFFINELVTKAETELNDILEEYDFYVFPVVNPDGYAYSHTSDRMWRKSRSRASPSTCVGVDLNRNFDVHHCELVFDQCNYRCQPVFCGDYPFSETEAAALRDFVLEKKSKIKLYISIHSYGQLWMIPYGYSKDLPPNHSYLEKLAKIGIQATTAVHGTEYNFGTIRRILYAVSGDSLDWVYTVANISLAFTIELRDKHSYGFLLPESQIIPTAEEVWAGIVALVRAL